MTKSLLHLGNNLNCSLSLHMCSENGPKNLSPLQYTVQLTCNQTEYKQTIDWGEIFCPSLCLTCQHLLWPSTHSLGKFFAFQVGCKLSHGSFMQHLSLPHAKLVFFFSYKYRKPFPKHSLICVLIFLSLQWPFPQSWNLLIHVENNLA
jgi:hypothetical protein